MTTLLIILGLIGLLLICAIVGGVAFRLRPARPRRGKHTTALHHSIFGGEEE